MDRDSPIPATWAIGLSLLAGFAAITFGHWIGEGAIR